MNTLRARIACQAQSGGLRRALLCGAAISGLAAIPSTAFAQDAVETAQTQAERVIVVQARRQNETLQEVPVTVTAIGGDTLQRFNIDQVADVTSRVPTLNVQVGGSGSGGQLSLRGVGSSNISAAFDSAVAFEYDGVVVSTKRMVQAGFFDVEQIDVLRGPQSLYFGKSATAGVLSLRSANPTSDWEVGMRGSYEFEEKGYLVSGYISGPITDTLGIRIAGQFNDIEEFQILQAGTPALTFIGAIGAALTASLRRGGLVLSILVLPLMVPVLIFGVSAAGAATGGTVPFLTPFLVLVALSLFAIVTGCLGAAAALRSDPG
jgi:iron complex outermembrane receptor protein